MCTDKNCITVPVVLTENSKLDKEFDPDKKYEQAMCNKLFASLERILGVKRFILFAS